MFVFAIFLQLEVKNSNTWKMFVSDKHDMYQIVGQVNLCFIVITVKVWVFNPCVAVRLQ